MIQIDQIETYGWKAAFRGMRNPKNSWKKGDSGFPCALYDPLDCAPDCDRSFRNVDQPCYIPDTECFIIGPNDMQLAKTLADAGQVHGKFLRQIGVSMDILAPLYWWKEYDTYKVGTVADSCSTMHKIAAKEFSFDDFSHEHLISDKWSEADNYGTVKPLDILDMTIAMLNRSRELYLKAVEAGDPARAKMFWWQLIQLLPSSYNQKRTVTMNYAVLKNIYEYRKDHKLNEWREFCRMIEDLPYAKELIIGGNNDD